MVDIFCNALATLAREITGNNPLHYKETSHKGRLRGEIALQSFDRWIGDEEDKEYPFAGGRHITCQS